MSLCMVPTHHQKTHWRASAVRVPESTNQNQQTGNGRRGRTRKRRSSGWAADRNGNIIYFFNFYQFPTHIIFNIIMHTAFAFTIGASENHIPLPHPQRRYSDALSPRCCPTVRRNPQRTHTYQKLQSYVGDSFKD